MTASGSVRISEKCCCQIRTSRVMHVRNSPSRRAYSFASNVLIPWTSFSRVGNEEYDP